MVSDPREAERTILERRADELARVETEQEAADHLDLVVVRCGGTDYGLETRRVREIQPLRHVTPLPHAERAWAGLINLRGAIYAVVALAHYLGPAGDPSVAAQVVIVGSAGNEIGLLVDETLGAERVRSQDLRPPPDAGSPRASVILGLTSRMLPVLDVEAILDDPRLSTATREES